MSEQQTADQRFVVETIAGIEVDLSMDQDGDLLIQLTDSVKTQAVYLSETEARQLRNWLSRVLP